MAKKTLKQIEKQIIRTERTFRYMQPQYRSLAKNLTEYYTNTGKKDRRIISIWKKTLSDNGVEPHVLKYEGHIVYTDLKTKKCFYLDKSGNRVPVDKEYEIREFKKLINSPIRTDTEYPYELPFYSTAYFREYAPTSSVFARSTYRSSSIG